MDPLHTAAYSRFGTVATLGSAQTLAWASSYYLPAMLALPMARDLGVATPTVFAAFSVALLVSAAVGPAAGRAIDRHGGRPVLMATSLGFACGLAALALAQGPLALFAAWVLIGVAMGAGLYEGAFATLVRLYGLGSRTPITGITLIAGFASTVGWPLSALLETTIGWRGACGVWAALHLLVGLPLNARLPQWGPAHPQPAQPQPQPQPQPHPQPAQPQPQPQSLSHGAVDAGSNGAGAPVGVPQAESAPAPLRTSLLLAFVFAVTWFVSTAMAAHLPVLLQAAGASLAVAVGAGALIGPAQVAGRLLDFGLLRRLHPLWSARLAALAHPFGAVALLVVGAPAAAAFALLHGAGNGIMTIAKGTLPLVLFGPQGYGARQGWLMMPARLLQGLAPLLFGIAIERWGAGALWLSGALGMAAFAALLALRVDRADRG